MLEVQFLALLVGCHLAGVCSISEYLEDLVTRIDTPHLHQIHITFFNQLIFDTLQLCQFLSHTEELESPDTAHVIFNSLAVQV